MTKAILLIVGYIFAIWGLSEFIHLISLVFSGKEKNTATIVVLEEKTALEQLSFCVSQSKWLGRNYSEALIAVYNPDISEQTLDLCRKYSDKNDVILVPAEVLENVVNAIF